MDINTVAQWVREGLAKLDQVLQVSQATRGVLDSVAKVNQSGADLARAIKGDGGQDLDSLYTAISLVRDDPGSPHLATVQDVLDAVSGEPLVSLPVTPPAGYGGASATEVWEGYSIPYDQAGNYATESAPYILMSELATHSYLSLEGRPIQWTGNPDFLLVGRDTQRDLAWQLWFVGATGRTPPGAIDWSDWDGAQSLVAFLNAQQATYTFSNTAPDGRSTPGWAWATVSSTYATYTMCRWPEWMLPYLSGRALTLDFTEVLDAITAAQTALETAISTSEGVVTGAISTSQGVVTGAISSLSGDLASARQDILDAIAALSFTPTPTAPVWPGLAGVTLGTPVALSSNVQIDEPCDGCIVAVTSAPTGLSVRNIGGMPYDYRAGELTFITDDGDAEPFQYLGFRAAIFTTKTMQRAAGIRARAISNAVGTITPWVITA